MSYYRSVHMECVTSLPAATRAVDHATLERCSVDPRFSAAEQEVFENLAAQMRP